MREAAAPLCKASRHFDNSTFLLRVSPVITAFARGLRAANPEEQSFDTSQKGVSANEFSAAS
jgi:hypothetical protein